MKAYYEEAGITIYHGDCREVLPTLPKVDVVLTDPPYGIKHKTNFADRGRGILARTSNFVPVAGDDLPFSPEGFISGPAILWGANYFCDHLSPVSGWLVWDKRVEPGKGVNDQADAELAWSNFVKGVRVFRHMWNGFWRDSERGESYHPTQKPTALMRWCLTLPWTPAGLVLDPFMGSGPTLKAAKILGRQAIGIEIEERYCEIAAKRLAQGVFDFAESRCESG